METEPSEEPQNEMLEENDTEDAVLVVAEDVVEISPEDSKESISVPFKRVSTISRTSEMVMKEMKKEEKRLMLKEVMDRLKKREAEEMEEEARKREREEELNLIKEEISKKSLASIQRRQSRVEKEEQDEQLLWTKLDDDIASDTVRTSRNSDLVSFATTLVAADADEEVDLPEPIESSSESESEDPRIQRTKSINPLQMAVKSLMLVPSISDISLSSEPVVQRKTRRSLKSEKPSNFIDPLADDTESLGSEAAERESSKTHSDTRSVVDDLFGDSESLQESSMEIIEDVPITETTDKDSQQYMDFESFFPTSAAKPESSAIDVAAELRFIETQQVVRGFLNQLIKSVVMAERPGTDEYIRCRLDKEKLLAALQSDVHDHLITKDIHTMLEDRMIEYYRRIKNKRPFDTLSLTDEVNYAIRHEHALSYLSYAQERLSKVKNKCSFLMSAALLDLSHAMHIAVSTEEHLEQTIRRLLARPDAETDFLKRFVARELRLMAEHRNRISDTRLLLISNKHTLSRITEKIKDIETVCDGVSMKDFMNVQTKVYALEKKIEERNLDLKKQRTQYHTDLHLTKHAREKSLALKNKLHKLEDELLEKNEIKHRLKIQLCRAKVEHKKIRGQMQELTYQGGLLAMPALMYDFDRTVDYLREKQESVSSLRETLKSITNRIDAMVIEERSTKSLIFP
nr:trichohyalin [Drosophila takahashii]